MALDAVANLVKAEVSVGYDAAAVSIVLAAGKGAQFPAAPFNVTWWNSTDYADPSDDPNVEIVRVTGRVTDTLAITRAQEGTGASTKNTGGKTYTVMLGITAKMITDIGGNLHKAWTAPQALVGAIDGNNAAFTFSPAPADESSILVWLAQQPQILGVHFTYSLVGGTTPTITYSVAPDASLDGLGHYIQFQ